METAWSKLIAMYVFLKSSKHVMGIVAIHACMHLDFNWSATYRSWMWMKYVFKCPTAHQKEVCWSSLSG